jgi:hypothetical protein
VVTKLPSEGCIPNVVIDVKAVVPRKKLASTLSEKSRLNDETKIKKSLAVTELPTECSIPNVGLQVEAVVPKKKSASTLSEKSNLNNEMPSYVAIPRNQTISHCFQIHSNEGHTIFSFASCKR